jgi:hypothetical protein
VESNQIHWILLAVIHNFLVGENYRGPDLQALKLIGRLRSVTTRRGVLRRGLLLERGGSYPLGKLLQVSGGSPARARATGLLALLGMSLMTFASHCLRERVRNKSENMIGILGTRYKSPMKKPCGVDIKRSGAVLKDRICPARGRICPIRTDPLRKMSTKHVFLLGFLSNLVQRLTSTLGTTYSKENTSIEGYKSRSQDYGLET